MMSSVVQAVVGGEDGGDADPAEVHQLHRADGDRGGPSARLVVDLHSFYHSFYLLQSECLYDSLTVNLCGNLVYQVSLSGHRVVNEKDDNAKWFLTPKYFHCETAQVF